MEAVLASVRRFGVSRSAHTRLELVEQRVGDIEVPTLLIWGNGDVAIGRAGVDGTPPYMKAEYRLVELDAGHWLIQEDTDRVLDEVMTHIKAHPAN